MPIALFFLFLALIIIGGRDINSSIGVTLRIIHVTYDIIIYTSNISK